MAVLASVTATHAQEAQPYRIAFWVEDEIYTISADGSGLLHLDYDPLYDAVLESVQWSPDGSQMALVMVSAEDGLAYLYLADGDGDNPRIFLSDPVSVNANPRWSPDGSQLIFRNETEIFVVNADGSNQQRIIEGYALRSMPRWSPDGAQLAYLTGELGNLNIVLLDLETGITRELVHEMTNGALAWSPTGEYIAFQHEVTELNHFTVNITTGEIVQLLAESSLSEHDFDWSPDGARIAINASHSGTIDIFTMRPDGSDIQQITEGDATMYTYSPDGQWIAYWYERNIWIMHPDGSGARQMTFDDDDNRLADWSPDSAEMLIFRFGEQHQLIIVNVETGETRELPGPPGDIRFAEGIAPYSP
jgi:TolB protein